MAADNGDDKFLADVREWFRKASQFEDHNRQKMKDDLKFVRVGGESQWPTYALDARRMPGQERPVLTDNRVKQFTTSVKNQLRQNTPAIKVNPANDKASKDTADILQGVIRNIEAVSKADIAKDTAAEFAVDIGLGYFGLMTKYVEDDSFDQDIVYRLIPDPFKVFFDPYSVEPDGSDAKRAMLIEDIDRTSFERDHPNVELTAWDGGDAGDLDGWLTEDTVRVAEFFEIREEKATLLLLADGTTMWDADYQKKLQEAAQWAKENPPPPPMPGPDGQPMPPPPVQNPMQPAPIQQQRETARRRCHWFKLGGNVVLERSIIPTSYIPIFPVYGEMWIHDDKRHVQGMVRGAKDPQRMFNYWLSSVAEQVALQPKTPFIAPEGSFEGHEDLWRTANTHNHPYLEYTVVTEGGQVMPRPERQPPPPVPTGYVEQMQVALEGIKAAVGMQDPMVGAGQSAQQSGKAIRALQQQGAIGTSHYADNQARTVEHAGRVLIEMIPEVYDSKRVLRILGEDGTPDYATHDPNQGQSMQEQPNPITGEVKTIYNLGVGRYDVKVTTGPSYGTKREEGFETMTEMMRVFPALGQVAGDLVMRLSDSPYADEMADRMKAAIPPQILQATENKQGDPQLMAAQQHIQQMSQQMQQMQQQMQQMQQENESKQMDFQAKAQEAQVKMAEAEVRKQELMVKMGELQQAQNPNQGQMEQMYQQYDQLQGLVEQLAQENQSLKEQAAQAQDDFEKQAQEFALKQHEAMLKERDMALKERQVHHAISKDEAETAKEQDQEGRVGSIENALSELAERVNAPVASVVKVTKVRDKKGNLVGVIKVKSDGTQEQVGIDE